MSLSAGRSTRDTYLGFGSLLAGVGLLCMVVARAVATIWGWFPSSWTAAQIVADFCGDLTRIAGLVLVGVGFLSASGRGRRLRLGAVVIALSFLTSLAEHIFSLYPARPEGLHGYQMAIGVAWCLLAGGALWVASAFASKDEVPADARARNWRLGVAGVLFAAAISLQEVASSSLVNWWWLDQWPFQIARAMRLTAAVLVPIGFFLAARSKDSQSSMWLARRDGLLEAAVVLWAISAALACLSWFLTLSQGGPDANWRWAIFWWLRRLDGLEWVLPCILAAVGFAASRWAFQNARLVAELESLRAEVARLRGQQ